MKKSLPIVVAFLITCCSTSTTTTPSFEIVSSQGSGKIKKVKNRYSGRDEIFQFIDAGKVKNLTGKSLNSYELFIDYKVYSEDGRSKTISDRSKLLLFTPNGFGSPLEQKIWPKDSEMPFKLNAIIQESDLNFPVSKVEALYQIIARDPFGYETNQYVLSYDITSEWQAAQRKL
jgi:hypothetical protein